MRLLVSVRDASEAAAALAGGADLVDAKEPSDGALGAVEPDVFAAIVRAVGGARPVTAAVGDATDESAIETTTHEFAQAGATLVKVGFAGIDAPGRATALLRAAMRGVARAERGAVVAVAYADASRVDALAPAAVLACARDAGAHGVLLDTATKDGPGLLGCIAPDELAAWVAEAREAGLLVALAGRLALADLVTVRDLGADVIGVRGAACDGGRTGRLSASRVRTLAAALADASARDRRFAQR